MEKSAMILKMALEHKAHDACRLVVCGAAMRLAH
jgi:hypothetical protein